MNTYQEAKAEANQNIVTIVSGQTSGTYIKLAEDMLHVLDERENNELRILPVVGVAGPQNIKDIMFLRGVDLAITENDYFDYLKKQNPAVYNGVERKVHYIAKLYNTEFHILAKQDITKLEDLEGKKVNFYVKDSSADIAAQNIFKALGINVEPLYLDQALATQKLKSGEIAAFVRMAGAPVGAFSDIKPEDGLHFIPIAESAVSSPDKYRAVLDQYLPAFLKSEDYPNLIAPGQSVPTVASSVLLATYNWNEGTERYNKVAKFVEKFFNNFQAFQKSPRHAKWRQTNLAATVPGWTRFKPAQAWLDDMRARAAQSTAAPNTAAPEMKEAFQTFIQDYTRRTSGADLPPKQVEELSAQFQSWWTERTRR